MNSPDDLPKDLTFTDPLITGRPTTLPITHEPKPDPPPTSLQKVRDVFIGLILLGGFFTALYAFSRLIMSHR